eukprot:Hpha_TRINITY_DN1972_c0_g1::TRINITY_DN1972_c0_g1_i1::g.30983::m.30983
MFALLRCSFAELSVLAHTVNVQEVSAPHVGRSPRVPRTDRVRELGRAAGVREDGGAVAGQNLPVEELLLQLSTQSGAGGEVVYVARLTRIVHQVEELADACGPVDQLGGGVADHHCTRAAVGLGLLLSAGAVEALWASTEALVGLDHLLILEVETTLRVHEPRHVALRTGHDLGAEGRRETDPACLDPRKVEHGLQQVRGLDRGLGDETFHPPRDADDGGHPGEDVGHRPRPLLHQSIVPPEVPVIAREEERGAVCQPPRRRVEPVHDLPEDPVRVGDHTKVDTLDLEEEGVREGGQVPVVGNTVCVAHVGGHTLNVPRAELHVLLHLLRRKAVVVLQRRPVGGVCPTAGEEKEEGLRRGVLHPLHRRGGPRVVLVGASIAGGLGSLGEEGEVPCLPVLKRVGPAAVTDLAVPLGDTEVEGSRGEGIVLAVVLDVVSALLQCAEVVRLVVLDEMCLCAVSCEVHVPSGKHGASRGGALSVHHVRLFELRALRRQAVRVGGHARHLQPVRIEALSPQGVREDEHKVHPALRLRATGAALPGARLSHSTEHVTLHRRVPGGPRQAALRGIAQRTALVGGGYA